MLTSRNDPPRTSQTQYVYTPLDHNAHSIRLLRILPREPTQHLIQCEICHANVDNTYVCLSYVWGAPRPTSKILVNGQYLSIRQNLLDFITEVSRSGAKDWFWIDALCIDQKSVSERNHQVQQMGLIFSRAQKVIAWLGLNAGIARFLKEPRSSGEDFYDFWSSEYWDRAWITQEVTLASQLTIMARNREMDAKILVQRMTAASGISLSHMPGNERFHGLSPTDLPTFKTKSLLELLYMFRFKECERPSDRIFSLLALCGEGSDLQVDYNWSPDDLARQALSRCPKSLCLCSARALVDVLGISTLPRLTPVEAQPFAQFTIQLRHEDESLNAMPDRITVFLRSMCSHFHSPAKLQIDPTCNSLSLHDGRKLISSHSKLCTVQFENDRKCLIVSFPFSTLQSIVSLSGYSGVCERPKGSLQLYSLMPENLGPQWSSQDSDFCLQGRLKSTKETGCHVYVVFEAQYL